MTDTSIQFRNSFATRCSGVRKLALHRLSSVALVRRNWSLPANSSATSRDIQRRRSLAWGMKWSSIYVGWSFFTRLIRGLVIPRIMAPAQYGLFASLSVLLNFSQYSDLGMRLSMAKRLPYTLAKESGRAS